MKINYTWLKEFVDIRSNPEDIAARLTMAGLAVDSIESHGGDHIFEFDLTSNRPDCLSHFGIAREVAAIDRTTLKSPKVQLVEVQPRADSAARVDIQDFELCPRYTARVITGVKVGPSPAWLAARLESVGVRSINNVADITNYILFALGQPLHAFDLKQLAGSQIIVRRARLGEKLVTLDGNERELTSEMLVIADRDRAVALGGIMGGADSEITDATSDVLLESAYFLPSSVRKTARALGMNTEASHRFERGADFEMAALANDAASQMIADLAGGKVLAGIIDVKVQRNDPPLIKFRPQRYEALTGLTTNLTEASSILRSLGLEVKDDEPANRLEAMGPSWRYDLAIEEDLIEEVARLKGYDQLGMTIPGGAGAGEYLPFEHEHRSARRSLTSLGFHEAVNFSFVEGEIDRKFTQSLVKEELIITNPIDETQSSMRSTLLGGLLKSVAHNFNHGSRNVRLFELGKCFEASEEERPIETERLGLVMTGARYDLAWEDASKRVDFYDLKGAIESLIENLGRKAARFSPDKDIMYLHPGRAAVISIGSENVGVLGQLHPRVAADLKFKQDVFVAELDFSLILNCESEEVRYRPLPRFPVVSRDLSILIDDTVGFGEIENAIRALGIPELFDLKLFDVYSGRELPQGKRALAFTLRYRSDDRTLTEAEVNGAHSRAVEEVVTRFKAEVR